MVFSYSSTLQQSPVDASRGQWTHGKLLAALVLLACVNGFYSRGVDFAVREGLEAALWSTFGVSAVVLAGIAVSCVLLARSTIQVTTIADFAVYGGVVICVLSPLSPLAWVALTGLALYNLIFRRGDDVSRRAFWVLLAVCYSSLWSRYLFKVFMDYILIVDAALVGFMSRQSFHGNLVSAADGVTTLQVLEGCSSFMNISLALVGWVTVKNYYGMSGVSRSAVFLSLSVFMIVLINTTRISIIAWRPDLYDLAHGAVGANIANMLSTLAIAVISYYGVRARRPA